MRKFEDALKHKADGDYIDTIQTLVNELYERTMELERKAGGVQEMHHNSLTPRGSSSK